MDELEHRVRNYWTLRAHDFGIVRKNELNNEISNLWLEEINCRIPLHEKLDILDIGTGTGYLAILLAEQGHNLTAVDFTPAMLKEAAAAAKAFGSDICFLNMDAQYLEFDDNSFDVIVTRNLTWTLPKVEKAYMEWHRVLRPGGVLLNFDAEYAENVRNKNQRKSAISSEGIYGHFGITPLMERENADITLSMPISLYNRPQWDVEMLGETGFTKYGADKSVGSRVLRKRDLEDAPLFLVWGIK